MLKIKENSTASALICSIFIALTLSACSPRVETLEIDTRPVEKPALVLPSADRIVTRQVEWIIITENNYKQVFERLKNENKDIVLFGVTAEGYENLALNISDLRAHIEQKNAIILAYRKYYIDSQNSLENAVIINN